MLTIRPGAVNGIEDVLDPNKRPVVISDETVAKWHGQVLADRLGCPILTFPAGEAFKTRATKAALEDSLVGLGLGRDSMIIAVGGGVTTDLVGFVAATYCRGVPLVLVPTSLLAMVDASIGGKVGVNTPLAKNYIGAFYQPHANLIDPDLLHTQPVRSYREGIIEMIKHGLIWDSSAFDWIEHNIDGLLEKDPTILLKAIQDSCGIKLQIVEKDRTESGLRRILNYGHTIGHALEAVSQYSISHGEAVAMGCLVEGHLSKLTSQDLGRIAELFKTLNYPLQCDLNLELIINVLKHDKKAVGGQPRFVTLRGIGTVDSHEGRYCTHFSQEQIHLSLEKILS